MLPPEPYCAVPASNESFSPSCGSGLSIFSINGLFSSSLSTILNNSNAALTFKNRLYGAVKFTGNSVVIPYGTSNQRPVSPEIGTARWNTDEAVLEVWDGTQFITSAGTQEVISAAEMDDLILEYTLIFG